MQQTVVPNGIKCTIKAGKRKHDRPIAIDTERGFNKAVHQIAKMLIKWRKRGKARFKNAELIMAIAKLSIKFTRNVQELGRRIREAFVNKHIVSFG